MCACLYSCNWNAFRVILLAIFTLVNCNKLRPVKMGLLNPPQAIVPLLSDWYRLFIVYPFVCFLTKAIHKLI